jgi:hypothetical protein
MNPEGAADAPESLAEAVERIGVGEAQDEMLAEFVDSFLLASDSDSRLQPSRLSRCEQVTIA